MDIIHHNLGKHMAIVIKEMCSRADVDYDSLDLTTDDWFIEYTWTAEEEEQFINWLADYLYENDCAREEIMVYPNKDMKFCGTAAMCLSYYYGFHLFYCYSLHKVYTISQTHLRISNH